MKITVIGAIDIEKELHNICLKHRFNEKFRRHGLRAGYAGEVTLLPEAVPLTKKERGLLAFLGIVAIKGEGNEEYCDFFFATKGYKKVYQSMNCR